MDLSIITVNYRSWTHLDAALTGLREAPEFRDGRWEMIVVDNASGDDQLALFRTRYPGVQFVENSGNLGFASGNNLGARSASGSTLLFMNPDVRAEPGEIRKLLSEKTAHREIAVLTAPQFDARGRLQKSFDRFPDLLSYFRTVRSLLRILSPGNNPNPRRQHDRIIDCDWISGSLLMIDKQDFTALGGWDEDFWMYAEDMDLCRRAAQRGMRRALTPGARFIHLHGGASRQNPAIACLTKTEVMISAHVYVEKHFRGLHRLSNHLIITTRNLVPLCLAAIANVLTVARFRRLHLSSQVLTNLVAYYLAVARTGIWLSRRSPNFSRA